MKLLLDHAASPQVTLMAWLLDASPCCCLAVFPEQQPYPGKRWKQVGAALQQGSSHVLGDPSAMVAQASLGFSHVHQRVWKLLNLALAAS